MILQNLQDSALIEPLHPKFKMLFDYVKSHDLSNAPAGRIVIDGDDLFINVDESSLIAQENQKLEVHRKYIDVHFPISCTEIIGWRALRTINVDMIAPFNDEKDFAFFAAPSSTYFEVHPGEFFIAYPEDAHAPIIGKGKIKKLVAKVRI